MNSGAQPGQWDRDKSVLLLGALSPQQANALRYRGQGLSHKAIAEKIGVSDPEIVYRYLRAAVEKLADPAEVDNPAAGRNPGALTDEVARRSGLATDLVRHDDLTARRRRPGRR
jgi:transposase